MHTKQKNYSGSVAAMTIRLEIRLAYSIALEPSQRNIRQSPYSNK